MWCDWDRPLAERDRLGPSPRIGRVPSRRAMRGVMPCFVRATLNHPMRTVADQRSSLRLSQRSASRPSSSIDPGTSLASRCGGTPNVIPTWPGTRCWDPRHHAGGLRRGSAPAGLLATRARSGRLLRPQVGARSTLRRRAHAQVRLPWVWAAARGGDRSPGACERVGGPADTCRGAASADLTPATARVVVQLTPA